MVKRKVSEDSCDKDVVKTDEKKISIFNYINAIVKHKDLTEEEQKNFDKYYDTWVADLFLSQNRKTLKFVQMMNINVSITKEAHFKFFHSFVYKVIDTSFIKYTAKKDKVKDESLQYLAQHFDCSEKDAENLLDIIEDDEKNQIVKMYKEYENRAKRIK